MKTTKRYDVPYTARAFSYVINTNTGSEFSVCIYDHKGIYKKKVAEVHLWSYHNSLRLDALHILELYVRAEAEVHPELIPISRLIHHDIKQLASVLAYEFNKGCQNKPKEASCKLSM